MNNPIACIYHTGGPVYDHFAGQLVDSLRRFAVPYEVEVIASVGPWVRNCAAKPAAILRAMDRNPGRDIIYLDADSQIVARPELFWSADCDLAVHYTPAGELTSGVIFLRNSPAVRALVVAWAERMAATPDVWDQKVIQQMLAEGVAASLKVLRLPSEYCHIKTVSADCAAPVVMQLQSSRVVHRMAAGMTFAQAMGCRRR